MMPRSGEVIVRNMLHDLDFLLASHSKGSCCRDKELRYGNAGGDWALILLHIYVFLKTFMHVHGLCHFSCIKIGTMQVLE